MGCILAWGVPAGVARWSRLLLGAGILDGAGLTRSGCHSPGSKSTASRAACSLGEPNAWTCDGSEKKLRERRCEHGT
jgi:hypothetical protein